MIRIALAQINTTVGDIDGNQRKICASIHQAKIMGARVVAFPELAITGYPPEDLLCKNHFIENNIKSLNMIAESTAGITAIIGFVDKKNRNTYNAAAIVSDGVIEAVYHKHELPNYGVFDEKRYFVSGHEPFLISVDGVLVGVNICEDIWVNDSVYLKQARAGARVLINISSSPYEIGKAKIRKELICRRAKETNAVVAYVNLIGGQDELVFDGGSFIVDSKGSVIATASQFEEDFLLCDLPLESVSHPTANAMPIIETVITGKRHSPAPLSAQSVKMMDETEEIYRALVLGTRDYVLKNGFKKVLIGLSGGIDSCLVAAIAVDAIGKDNVIGISMPTQFNSRGTRADARKMALNLGIECHEIPIKKLLKEYLLMLEPWFVQTTAGIAEENIQARIRGNILMAFSNKFNWLVLTTGNKSEMAVGYCTLYGDMSGGFAVIKDVLKTKVYELARFRNMQAGKMLIPKTVLLRAPSAELRENQTDQDSLPQYEVLDQILVDYIEKHHSLAQMTRDQLDPSVCQKVMNLVDKSEYKRRQSPPGIKISSRAFGKDWRLPITSKYKEM